MNNLVCYRLWTAFLAFCAFGLSWKVLALRGPAARRSVMFWALVGGALLCASVARADGYELHGTGGIMSGGGPVGLIGDGSQMIPVVWDNETGVAVQVELIGADASTVYYTVFPTLGVSAMSWIWVPAGSPWFQASCPSDLIVGDVHEVPIDLSGTNINYVTFYSAVGPVTAAGWGGVSVVNYPYVRPDQAGQFLWPWFLAGWGLGLGGIAFQLVFRQVRNIGNPSPSM